MDDPVRKWKKAWPPWVTDDFTIKQPVTECIRDIAADTPDQIAIDYYGTEFTYQAINEEIDRFAWGLVGLGLRKGDRVALQMPNCPQFIISYFGILRAGGVVVAMNPMFKSAELEYEIRDAALEIFICSDALFSQVAGLKEKCGLRNIVVTRLNDYLFEAPCFALPDELMPAEIDLEGGIAFTKLIEDSSAEPICRIDNPQTDLALLQYTGGTIGMPKGAMISHHGLALASLAASNWFNLKDGDINMGVAPFFHIMGMVQCMCSPLSTGAKIVVLTRFVPDTVAQALQYKKCTAWVGATTMLIALLQMKDIDKYLFTSLRYVVSGGSTISVEIQEKFKKLIPNATMHDGYGLTECISQGGAVTPLGGYRSGYVGVPYINDLNVVDPEKEQEMPPGEQGEIVLRGPCLMLGYWQRPEETKKSFKNGWFYTGDIGSMDERGYVKISGRNKELIKCSGYSVFPDEVEKLIYMHEAVSEVAVIGVPDTYRGESPKAFVVLAAGYKNRVSENELLGWCKENMAAYKCPRHIEIRENLPKSAAGKLLRRMLGTEA